MVVNKTTKEIICTLSTNGKRHDFRLFKESKVHAQKSTQILTDTDYQGLKKIHANTEMPKKKSKKRSITKADKQKIKYKAFKAPYPSLLNLLE